MFTANTAASNTASSAPAVSFREGDFYDLAAETDDYSAGLYEIPVTPLRALVIAGFQASVIASAWPFAAAKLIAGLFFTFIVLFLLRLIFVLAVNFLKFMRAF